MRSFDWKTFKDAAIEFNGSGFDYEGWVANHYNVLYIDGDDVGVLTYEYPGVYTGHWFFVSRGKAAIAVASKMLQALFTDFDAKVVRGLTPTELRGARYLAKRLGFVSLGFERFPNGEHEVMFLSKQAFEDTQK